MAEAGFEPRHSDCGAQYSPSPNAVLLKESWLDERLEVGRVGGIDKVVREPRVLMCVLKVTAQVNRKGCESKSRG